MITRTLGDSGMKVSAIGRGCMGLSQALAPVRDEVSIATKLGFSFDGTRSTGLDSRRAAGHGPAKRVLPVVARA